MAGLIIVVALVWAASLYADDVNLFGPPPEQLDINDQPPLRINRPNMIMLCDAYLSQSEWKLTYVLSGENLEALAEACLE